jgi:hypothetical protein
VFQPFNDAKLLNDSQLETWRELELMQYLQNDWHCHSTWPIKKLTQRHACCMNMVTVYNDLTDLGNFKGTYSTDQKISANLLRSYGHI